MKRDVARRTLRKRLAARPWRRVDGRRLRRAKRMVRCFRSTLPSPRSRMLLPLGARRLRKRLTAGPWSRMGIERRWRWRWKRRRIGVGRQHIGVGGRWRGRWKRRRHCSGRSDRAPHVGGRSRCGHWRCARSPLPLPAFPSPGTARTSPLCGRGLPLEDEDGALEAWDEGQDLGNRSLRGCEENVEEANGMGANEVEDGGLVGGSCRYGGS